MHTNEPREDPLVEMGYEVRDIDYPKVLKATIIFFVFTGFCALLGFGMYTFRLPFFFIAKPKPAGLIKQVPPPQFPLLQDNIDSKTDISVLRQQETTRMLSTGYNQDGSVHIPVDRAMTLIAERGLPPTQAKFVPPVNDANIFGPQLLPPTPPNVYGTPNPPSAGGLPSPAAPSPETAIPAPAGSNPLGQAPVTNAPGTNPLGTAPGGGAPTPATGATVAGTTNGTLPPGKTPVPVTTPSKTPPPATGNGGH